MMISSLSNFERISVTCHVPRSTIVNQPGIATICNSACKSGDKGTLFLCLHGNMPGTRTRTSVFYYEIGHHI
jgi:hypothetical protein